MKGSRTIKITCQRGVALVVALVLLLMLTILGVASMSGSIMQERMAGNVNLQAWAFEAASAGVSDSVKFALPENWGVDESGDPRVCERGGGEWQADWGEDVQVSPPDLPDGISVSYRQKVGCFEAEDSPDEWDEFEDVSLQTLVLNRGEVKRADGTLLARREVEVRVGQRGQTDCLLTIGPVDPDGIDMGTSKKGIVDGGAAGCPIRTADPVTAAEMNGQLSGNGGSSRLENYKPNPPGIHSSGPLPGVWNDAENLARAVNALKIGIRAWNVWQDNGLGPPDPFASCEGTLHVSTPATPPTGGLHYIADSLDVSGSEVARGTIITEGGIYFNGNATYRADLVSLGGVLDVAGFGNAGNKGLLQLHNLWNRTLNQEVPAYDPNNVEFINNTMFNVSGMGTASITADECDEIVARWDRVNQCLADLETEVDPGGRFGEYKDDMDKALPSGSPAIDVPDFGAEEDTVRFPIPKCGGTGQSRNVLASWREYIDRERWVE